MSSKHSTREISLQWGQEQLSDGLTIVRVPYGQPPLQASNVLRQLRLKCQVVTRMPDRPAPSRFATETLVKPCVPCCLFCRMWPQTNLGDSNQFKCTLHWWQIASKPERQSQPGAMICILYAGVHTSNSLIHCLLKLWQAADSPTLLVPCLSSCSV